MELGQFDRFGDVIVHAGPQALFPILVEGIGGHGQDGERAAAGQPADGRGGLQPVHDRHLDVHQHQVKGGLVHHLDRGFAIVGEAHPHAHAFQQQAGHLLVDHVILDQQDVGAAPSGQFPFGCGQGRFPPRHGWHRFRQGVMEQ
jgi:hypothetical protein